MLGQEMVKVPFPMLQHTNDSCVMNVGIDNGVSPLFGLSQAPQGSTLCLLVILPVVPLPSQPV